MRRVPLAILSVLVAACFAACFEVGEPTGSAALVTWAAYPDTVVAGQLFSFEFAGPVATSTCGRLDTASVVVSDSAIVLSARRSTYRTLCSSTPVAFYEARPMRMPRSGRWRVSSLEGRQLGDLVAVDSGAFSPVRSTGEGTVSALGGCLLFGPGWVGNQRLFALRDAPSEVSETAGTGRRVRIRGTFGGFTMCGSFGSRPVIRVISAVVTDSTADEYY